MLIDEIRQQMIEAMKAKDAIRLRTLRSIIAAVQSEQVSGTESKTLSNAEVQKVIAGEVKKRVEAAEGFESAGADERRDAELAEKIILESYMPSPLTDDEVVELVETTLETENITSKQDMGKAMKLINEKIAGRASGKLVAELVKSKLV